MTELTIDRIESEGTRRMAAANDNQSETRIVAVLNHKGGVGKTVLATEIPMLMAGLGQKVLVIDMDAQTNLTLNMGFYQSEDTMPTEHIAKSIYRPDKHPLINAIIPVEGVPNLFIIPGHTSLDDVAELITAGDLSDTRLDDLIKDFLDDSDQHFDWIFIDCPPGLGVLSTNALIAANEVMVPVDLRNTNALVGVGRLGSKIAGLRRRAPRDGIFLVGNMFGIPGGADDATNDEQDNLADMPRLGYPVADTVIEYRKAIFKSHNRHTPLTIKQTGLSKGGKKATENLSNLAKELKSGKLRGRPVSEVEIEAVAA